MIILRQKEYATGAERAMIAMNKGKNISPKPISERAALISQDKRDQAIRKINQSLGPESIKGRGGSIMGHLRGKEARMRVKMGYNTPEAVERLRQKKLHDLDKDKTLTSEFIESKMRETLGTRVKNAGEFVTNKIKEGVRNSYEHTGRSIGKGAGWIVENPGLAASQVAGFGIGFALPAEANATYQAVTTAMPGGPGSYSYGLLKAAGVDNIPVKKKIRDRSGQIITKKIPLKKILGQAAKKTEKRIGRSDWSVKGGLEKIKESHRASHPYENRVLSRS